ncbi:hypothetical protein [uncultured Pelagimonas sp.]|uniref:hypothetical protein n=1 Tax=uncultured Pelagimonas sp. TaxID=1618102 RepID=UPI002603B2B6|nr:hypothetical protein [uncultured Pelagimonas sp.]
MSASRDTHSDAELLADIVRSSLSREQAPPVRQFARGEWCPSWNGIENPDVLVGQLSANRHLGEAYSWPRIHQYKGQGKTGSEGTVSHIASISVQNPYHTQLAALKTEIAFQLGIMKLLVILSARIDQITGYTLDLTPPKFRNRISDLFDDKDRLTALVASVRK